MIPTRSVRNLLLGPTLAALAVYGAWAYPAVFQRGLTISKPGMQPGYVIFAAADGNTYAIDIAGKVAGKWPSPEANTGADYTRPLANGNLLARIKVKGNTRPAGGRMDTKSGATRPKGGTFTMTRNAWRTETRSSCVRES